MNATMDRAAAEQSLRDFLILASMDAEAKADAPDEPVAP